MTEGALWTSVDAARATRGRATADFTLSGLSIDSRSIAEGDLFIALKGQGLLRDGHDFVHDAFARGAAAAMVSGPVANAESLPLLIVDDTLAALEALGTRRRAEVDSAVVAITGSVGKTGTKEALAHVLAGQGRTHASVSSYNNLWGVPLSLARMPRDTQFGVFEIGMNHAGEIRPLTRQVRPDIAVITTVEAVHLEFFESTEGIADAKAEIFEGLSGGTAILNRDNAYWNRLEARARACGATSIVNFGSAPDCEVQLLSADMSPEGSRATVDLAGRRIDVVIGLPGRHIVMNGLAVLAAVLALDANVEAAAASLRTLRPVDGRGAKSIVAVEDGAITLIDESYNASPVSIRAALAVFRMVETEGRRIAVLGDMRELGKKSDDLHGELAPDVAESVDLVFACGPHMRRLFDALPPGKQGAHAGDSTTLAAMVVDVLRAGDSVMVKGSLGSRMKFVVEAIRSMEGQGRRRSAVSVPAGGA